eukprot:5000461-Amphidinium_carterae.1
MVCRTPNHNRCTKELSVSVAGGRTQALQVLKSWALAGDLYPDREGHMSADVKKQLMAELKGGLLLPEADLDAKVSVAHA